jgi:hypothetical protein
LKRRDQSFGLSVFFALLFLGVLGTCGFMLRGRAAPARISIDGGAR